MGCYGIWASRTSESWRCSPSQLTMFSSCRMCLVTLTQLVFDSFGRQPVLGFVFLCQYASEEEKEDAPSIPKELWFANQVRPVPMSDA